MMSYSKRFPRVKIVEGNFSENLKELVLNKHELQGQKNQND